MKLDQCSMEFQFQGESPSAFQSGDDEKSISTFVPPKFDQVLVRPEIGKLCPSTRRRLQRKLE